MTIQQVYSKVRRCCEDYNLISENDRIAVGVSGGKDSITLALALKGLERFYPKHFTMGAFMVDMGFPETEESLAQKQALIDFFAENQIPFDVIKTEVGPLVFETRKEQNPCSLCSKMRKGAMYEYVVSHGYNKVALGHNMEDVVESFLMSLIYEGRIHTFSPSVYLDRTGLFCIRPLIYMPEQDIVYFANKNELPIYKSQCPANGFTKREEAKQQLISWNRNSANTTVRIFTAIKDGLWTKEALQKDNE